MVSWQHAASLLAAFWKPRQYLQWFSLSLPGSVSSCLYFPLGAEDESTVCACPVYPFWMSLTRLYQVTYHCLPNTLGVYLRGV